MSNYVTDNNLQYRLDGFCWPNLNSYTRELRAEKQKQFAYDSSLIELNKQYQKATLTLSIDLNLMITIIIYY